MHQNEIDILFIETYSETYSLEKMTRYLAAEFMESLNSPETGNANCAPFLLAAQRVTGRQREQPKAL
jgi:hypothetical protein